MIDPKQHPDGYALLQCLRAYLNLNMYTGFNVHTMETIAAGENALEVFAELMKVYLYSTSFFNTLPDLPDIQNYLQAKRQRQQGLECSQDAYPRPHLP